MENTNQLYSITVTLTTGEKKLYGSIKGYELTNSGHLIMSDDDQNGHEVIIAAGQWVEFWRNPMQGKAVSVGS